MAAFMPSECSPASLNHCAYKDKNTVYSTYKNIENNVTKLEVIMTEILTKKRGRGRKRNTDAWSRDRSGLEGRLQTSKRAGKDDVLSRSPDLAQLNPNVI